MRLLELLLPAIYADPDRDRKCANCGVRSPARFCSEPCAHEYWADMTA